MAEESSDKDGRPEEHPERNLTIWFAKVLYFLRYRMKPLSAIIDSDLSSAKTSFPQSNTCTEIDFRFVQSYKNQDWAKPLFDEVATSLDCISIQLQETEPCRQESTSGWV